MWTFKRLVVWLSLMSVLISGCGESDQAKRAKVINWVKQLKANPSLADKEEFTNPINDYAELAAKEFPKLLKQNDKSVKIAALKVLAKLKRLSSTESIIQTIKSPDPDIREQVAKTLASFSSPLTIKPLIAMTNDPNLKVRISALEGLGKRSDRDAPPYLQEVLPYLTSALDSPNPKVRQAAVNGLSELGQWSLLAIANVQKRGSTLAKLEAEKAFNQICEGFRKDLRENSDRLIRRDMARYLGELRYKPAFSDLTAKLDDPDPEVRIACAHALGNLYAEKAKPKLKQIMSDTREEMSVRTATAVALGKMGQLEAIQFLTDNLTSSDERVRTVALDALKAVGKPATKLLIHACQDKDDLKRWSAVAVLGDIGDPTSAEVLLKALSDPSENVRVAAASSLGKLKYPPAVYKLVNALNDSSQRVQSHAETALEKFGGKAIHALLTSGIKVSGRWRIFRLLGKLKGKQAIPVLVNGLNDKETKVRQISAWALGEIGDLTTASVILTALNDPDPSVRREAALALGKMKVTKAKTILSEKLEAEKDETVKTSIRWALNQLELN